MAALYGPAALYSPTTSGTFETTGLLQRYKVTTVSVHCITIFYTIPQLIFYSNKPQRFKRINRYILNVKK